MKTLWTIAATLLLTTPALGATLADVTLPDTMPVQGKTLKLNGLGLREATIFGVDVYVAGLYLEEPSKNVKSILDPTNIKHLEIRTVRSVPKSALIDAFESGLDKNAPGSRAKYKTELETLYDLFLDVRSDESFGFTYVPETGLTVIFGKQVRGAIANKEFSSVFYALWLGPHPPNEGLKKGLLGL